jgi:hypothetical protein
VTQGAFSSVRVDDKVFQTLPETAMHRKVKRGQGHDEILKT